MPVNSQKTTSFNPYDEDSWFFGFVSRTDATQLLSNNEDTGAFLVRESATAKGDLVLSVKENNDRVSHYIINRISPTDKSQQLCFRIGEQIFLDMPTLLTFYQLNNLDDTPLRVPAKLTESLSQHVNKRSFTKDYLAEARVHDINSAPSADPTNQTPLTKSQSTRLDTTTKTTPSALQRKLPGLAKVIQSRIPNAYDKTALTLHEGDIVRVTKTDISGCWEGEISGRKGHFPFNYVKFMEDSNE